MDLETFDWAYFFKTQGIERATLARELSAEAVYLAKVAIRPELRTGYLRLAKELMTMADEFEGGASSV